MSRKGGGPPPPMVLDTLEKVRKLRDAWLDDDAKTVLQTAPSLLDKTFDQVQEAVYQIYVDALIQESQFDRVLQIVQDYKKTSLPKKSSKENNNVYALSVVHIYALYRLDRYTEAQALATEVLQQRDEKHPDFIVLQHLLAQCLYRTGNIKAAREAYEKLFLTAASGAADTNEAQIATNLVATQVSNATPFVDVLPSNNDQVKGLLEKAKEDSTDSAAVYPYELAYNVATRDILAARHLSTAMQQLEFALQQAEAQTAGWSEADRLGELAPIRTNLDWARVFWQGGTTDASSIPMKYLAPSGKLVALVNRALDMPKAVDGLRLLPLDTSKFTPLQARALHYNRAILQYKANQWDECLETCRNLQSSLSRDSGGKQKEATTSTAPDTKVEALWWETRVTVLQVRAQLQKGGNKYNKTTAEQALQSLIQTLLKQPESSVRDHAVAYLECHKASIAQGDDLQLANARLALLESLPDSWKSKPAVVASTAALYQQEGKAEKAVELVKSTGHEDALADLLLSQGQYAAAVELYESADLSDPIAQARYARALTFCDPTKALEYWNKVRPVSVLDDAGAASTVDGTELELRPVPRLRSSSPRRTISQITPDMEGNTNNNSSSKPRKSHEAILRQRARKREAYLAELDRKGLRRATHPDPERWLPKFERSHNRRRRNKGGGAHKGAQGGVSDKDAAQFDVAARQAARASGETAGSTSTAHIAAVSSGGPARKGGRRR